MAKYTQQEDEKLRKALIDFINGESDEDDIEKERNYRKNLSFRAIANDVTGSLGVWGITHQ